MMYSSKIGAMLSMGSLIATTFSLPAQWTWTVVSPIPLPTANHAVCAALVDGNWYAYSFGGITTGLTNEAIHRSCFRYDVAQDIWMQLPDLPDTLGKIASAASVVDGIAYVIGGYHVFDGPPFELSSDRVHRLDLENNTWLPDGAPIPVPIDDHVQAVWRDSLIYVITGWSNTTNVPLVQVYDPAFDNWMNATPVPNNNQFKAFGASGVILGDSIFYYGGASTAFNFPAQDRCRVGAINPLDPTLIDWLPAETGPYGPRYRSASVALNGTVAWVGGSATSYNYDAIAYNGSGVVEPVSEIPVRSNGNWESAGHAPHRIMDLRGVGDMGSAGFLVAGGIGLQRHVLDSAYIIQYPITDIEEHVPYRLQGYPNPALDRFVVPVPSDLINCRIELFDLSGRDLGSWDHHGSKFVLSVIDLRSGAYVLHLGNSSISRIVRFNVMDPMQ